MCCGSKKVGKHWLRHQGTVLVCKEVAYSSNPDLTGLATF